LTDSPASIRTGFLAAVFAYVVWGLFPLFWRQLATVPAVELVCHRVIWSTVFLVVAIAALRCGRTRLGLELTGDAWRGRSRLSPLVAQPPGKLWTISFVAAIVISINWLSFIWAVNNGRILESSLGYYIAPLVSVGLGVAVMKDRLTRWQWASILIAGAGVSLITWAHGSIPWVSLAMAFSFAIYGLLKKRTGVPPLVGLLMENVILALPASIYLFVLTRGGSGSMGQLGWSTDALIVTGGVITVPPLMLFAVAARRVSLSTIGMLQYIGPTLQFIVGVEVGGETLTSGRLVGFAFVWTGSIVYIYAAQMEFRKKSRIPPSDRLAS
jgi:chloramphenicol-sensitive protein RarD